MGKAIDENTPHSETPGDLKDGKLHRFNQLDRISRPLVDLHNTREDLMTRAALVELGKEGLKFSQLPRPPSWTHT